MSDKLEKSIISISEGVPRNLADFDPKTSGLWISLAENEWAVVQVTGLDEYLPGANVNFSLWSAISNPEKKKSGGSDYDFTLGKTGGACYIRDIEGVLKEASFYLQLDFVFPANTINNQTEIFTGPAWKIITGIVREDVKLVTVSSPQLPLRKIELYGNWFAVGFDCTNLTQPELLLFTTFDGEGHLLGEKNITLPVPLMRMGKLIKRYGKFRLHEFLMSLKPSQGYCVVMDTPNGDYWVGVIGANKLLNDELKGLVEYLKNILSRRVSGHEKGEKELEKYGNSASNNFPFKSREEVLAEYKAFENAIHELERMEKGAEDE